MIHKLLHRSLMIAITFKTKSTESIKLVIPERTHERETNFVSRTWTAPSLGYYLT